MWQVLTPKMFDNLGTSSALRRLFTVYIITLCGFWMKNLVLYIRSYQKANRNKKKQNHTTFDWTGAEGDYCPNITYFLKLSHKTSTIPVTEMSIFSFFDKHYIKMLKFL